MHPTQKPKISYLSQSLGKEDGVFVAASDYLKAIPDSVSRWFPRKLHSLGTDGFGRSESRQDLRDFFEVDDRHIVLATLTALAQEKMIQPTLVQKAIKKLAIDPNKINPMTS